MKQISVTLNGTTPLLMNSNLSVNPMHPLSKELKEITGKRKKTDEDTEKILQIKWLLALYHDESVGPYIPAQNVEASIREAGKRTRRGKDVQVGIRVDPDFIPLQYEGPRDIKILSKDIRFNDTRVGRIKSSSILVCRPRFNHWKIEFQLEFDEDIFNLDEIKELLTTAGRYAGLCDYRQRYGHFEAIINS